jgi:hypothetical protein
MQHVKNENALLVKRVSQAGFFCSSALCHGDFLNAVLNTNHLAGS